MSMNQPSKEEIIKGVIAFLKDTLAPQLKEHARFQTLISASLLEIVLRELTLDPESFLPSGALDALLGREGQERSTLEEKEAILCERIRQGAFDEGEAKKALFRYLSQEVQYKIQVDNPKW